MFFFFLVEEMLHLFSQIQKYCSIKYVLVDINITNHSDKKCLKLMDIAN